MNRRWFLVGLVATGVAAVALTAEQRRRALEFVAREKRYNRLAYWTPYAKQRGALELTATKREVGLIAANQIGKTETGAFLTATVATGRYPPWWKGRRFDGPVRWWAVGETSVMVRDVQQKKLCGEAGVDAAYGTGLIPKECLVDKSLARGVTDSIDTLQVRHESGGISVIKFKSYEQGRTKFQGESVDGAWCDEEPEQDIYSEILTRISATGGMVFSTLTPLKGKTTMMVRFLDEVSEDRAVVSMTLEDAEHYTAAQRAKIIAGWPAHERDARARGVPMLGSGRIFTVPIEGIAEPALTYIPAYWTKLWGIDLGIDHPFGAALIIWDRDNDVIHLHHVIRMVGALPLQHAVPMKAIGAAVPVAWPHDAAARDKGSGEPISRIYRQHGLLMLPEHATFPGGGFSTDAAIAELQDRMTTGRFKVANHLSEFFEEYLQYHRKDGQIVKERDDILSALFKAIMMKRYARAVPLGSANPRAPETQIAKGMDFNVWDPSEDAA